MATPNAIAVALFNAAAGGYTAQIAADPNSLANAVGMILEKDISNDALFVEHLLSNFGVTSSMSIYTQARSELFNLVATQGRGKAVVIAIDFLKSQEGAWNDYALVALNFSVKVSEATLYSANNPTQRDITKLVSGVTGVDTDQVAITEALAATNPAFSASLQSAVASATAIAQAEKTAALAAQKAMLDAIAKAASDKAAADLKAAQDKATADAAAAKAAFDKVIADTAATLKAADNLAIEAAIKAAADKAAAAAAVDKTVDNANAITAFLKATAASLGLTGYETMTDTQLVNIIKYSDNQSTAAAVDKTTDNPTAITNFLKSTATDLGVSGTASMSNSQLITAIRTVNDAAVAAAQKVTDDAVAKAAADKAIADAAALKVITDAAAAQAVIDRTNAVATQKATDDAAAAALKIITDAAAAKAAADLQTALSQIQTLQNVTGRTQALSLGNDTILAVSGGNDTVTATNLTYGTDDLVVDTSLIDMDVLTLSTADDISASPVVVGIENINVNVTSVYGGDTGPTVLSFNADNLRNGNLNFDVTNVSSVVTGLVVTNLPLGVPVTSSNKFTSASISADDNAVVNYTGYATTLTLDSAGTLTDVNATVRATTAGTISTDSDATVTVVTAADTTVTAPAAASVIVTSAGQATITANAADRVTVTATEEALVTANAATTVTFVTGDGIDTTSASVIASTLTSTNTNTITVNVAGRTSATVLDISGAANVNTVNVTGTQNVTLKVSLVGIDGLGTATTGTTADDNLLVVTNANSGTTTLWVKTTGGDADFSQANVNSIVLGAGMGTADDLTVATGALIVTAADQANDLDIIAKNSSGNSNSVRVTVQDNGTAGVDGDLTGGLKLTTFATATLTNNDANAQAGLGAVNAAGTALTIAAGTQGFAETSTINLGSASLSVTGSGAVDLGSAVTAASVLGSSALGAITLGLTGLDTVGTVTTGLGNDVLSISSAVRNSSGAYTLVTGAGTDTLTLSIAQDFSWNAGADYDTLKVVGDLDVSAKSISLTSVDEIALDTTTLGAKTFTISAATFNTNPVFNLRGTAASSDLLLVQGSSSADTINASSVAVEVNTATLKIVGGAGNDIITGSSGPDIIDGGLGNDQLSGGSYGDTYIFNTGDVDAGETIVESTTGIGTDTVWVVTTTDFRNMTTSSFDEIEAITLASNQTAKFTGLQLTGESIVLTGDVGVEAVEVYVEAGEQFVSGLTNPAANINTISYFGTTGAETITGGAMSEIIKGGAGNDLLAGGLGADTYMFDAAASNGIDRITFGVVDGSAIDDTLNFTADTFLGVHTVQVGKYNDTSVATPFAHNIAGDNVLILQRAYFADAAALVAATTSFDASFAGTGKVLIIYAESATTDARIAVATITDAGDVTAATDVAVLVGLTVAEAYSGFSASNFTF